MTENIRKSNFRTPATGTKKEWMTKLERLTGKPVEVPFRQGIAFLAIDCSASMKGDKIEQARTGSIEYARHALKKGYSVGVITFSSKAQLLAEAQDDIEGLASCLSKLKADGTTDMAGGIALAKNLIFDKRGSKVICIVTDGEPDDRSKALARAMEAREANVEIATIGTDDADAEFLASLASSKNMSVKVSREELHTGIASMAKTLPCKL